LEYGFLRAFDDEIAAVVKRAFVYGRGIDIRVLVQDTDGRIDHNGKLPNTDLGNRLVYDSRLVHIQSVADGVFDVDVDGHIGRICEVAQLRNIGQHDFVRAVVFVDMGLVNLQVGECDFGFQQVLVQFGDEVFVGANHHGVEHINGLVELAIHAIVVGFQLVSDQHRRVSAFEIGFYDGKEAVRIFPEMTEDGFVVIDDMTRDFLFFFHDFF
jgi:hypothetical protein